MRDIANPIFLLPIFVALGIYVVLRMGGVMLPGGRAITKADNPRSYWIFLGLAFAVLAVLTALGVFEALPASVVRGR